MLFWWGSIFVSKGAFLIFINLFKAPYSPAAKHIIGNGSNTQNTHTPRQNLTTDKQEKCSKQCKKSSYHSKHNAKRSKYAQAKKHQVELPKAWH